MPEDMNLGFSLQPDHEEEIDLVNLVGYVLRRWRKLLIIALIGCLLGGMLGYFTTENATLNPDNPAHHTALATVENLNMMYQRYQTLVQENHNSYLFNLSEGKTYYKGTQNYYLAVLGTDFSDMVDTAFDIHQDREAIAELKTLLGIAPEDAALDRMLRVSISGGQDHLVTASDTNRIITYEFNYIQEDSQDAIAAFIESWMTQQAAFYKQQKISLNLRKLSCGFIPHNNVDITDVKDGIVQQAENIRKKYAELYVAVRTNKDNQFGDYSESILETHARQTNQFLEFDLGITSELKNTIKYSVIALIGFVCLGGLWLVAKYMLMNRIHSVGELSNTYGMRLIGYIPGKPSTDWLDKKLRKMIEPGVGAKTASSCEYLLAALSQMDMDRICLSQVTMTTASTALCNALRTGGANSIRGELHRDGTFLKEVCRCGKVVLVVTLEETSHTDIQVALEVCRLHHIEVAGAIIVENTYC